MLVERDQEKLWSAAYFLMEHERLSEMEPIIKILLGETLSTLDKPVDVVNRLEIALSGIDSQEDLNRLHHLESSIKQLVQGEDLHTAHKLLIEYISTVAANQIDIIAALLAAQSVQEGQKNSHDEQFFRVGEASQKIGVSTQTIKRHCEEGRFSGAHRTPGGHWRIPRSLFRTTSAQDAKAAETLRGLDEKNRNGGEVENEFNLL